MAPPRASQAGWQRLNGLEADSLPLSPKWLAVGCVALTCSAALTGVALASAFPTAAPAPKAPADEVHARSALRTASGASTPKREPRSRPEGAAHVVAEAGEAERASLPAFPSSTTAKEGQQEDGEFEGDDELDGERPPTTTEVDPEDDADDLANPWEEAFLPVNGGNDRMCKGGGESEWENPFRIHHQVKSLEACQDMCKDMPRCTGVSFSEKAFICEVWNKPILGSQSSKGKQCHRYHSSDFRPVTGGVDRACTAAKQHPGKEGQDYREHQASDLYVCKTLCHTSTDCLGVSFHKASEKCQVWIRPVAGSKKSEGYLCMRRELPGFRPVDGGMRQQCVLGEGDDADAEHTKVHKGDHSLYECKSRCAHHGVRCEGVNFDQDERTCEMWLSQINASKTVKHKMACFSYEAPAQDSLYCAALMVPWTDEPKLLAAQYKHRLSIFACDEFAVFSNPVTEIGGSLETKLIDIDLHVERGGEYNTSLNTPIFIKFWQVIAEEARYKHHGWVVKADPDTVFFPERLRWILRTLSPVGATSEKGFFLNNCQLGMHGPIEVMTSRAFDTYAQGNADCWQAEQEDVYIENCFRQLEVTEVNNFDTIAEKDCWRGTWHQYPDWDKCDTPHASFHPFKTVKDYHSCWSHAMKAGAWPPSELHDVVA